MSLRIGIDMDSTLMDAQSVWRRHYDEHMLIHRHAATFGASATWAHPQQLCRMCFVECCESPDLLQQSELMPYAHQCLARLVEDGASLHLITGRSADLEHDVRRLLVRRSVAEYFASVWVTTAPKSGVVEPLALDFMLDDSPAVYADIKENTSTVPIIFDQPWNRHLAGLRVQSWPEFVAQMTEPLEVA